MLNSIKSKLILAVVVMAALLAALTYFTWAQMADIQGTLSDLASLQDVKTHVMAPQKDMNQFIAAMDSTVLFLELGDAASAQEAYDGSVDAEQDISGEFEYLEANAPEDILPTVAQAHLDWEIAMEYMKIRAEVLAGEQGLVLTRPSTDLKVTDAHVDEAKSEAEKRYASMSYAELAGLAKDAETDPVEASDEGIDTSDEMVGEFLEAERAAGDKAVADSSRIVLLGSLGVLAAIIAIGAVMTVSLSKPLSALKAGAEAIAGGDLDYQFKNVPSDEVGSVIHSVQAMADGLKGRIRTLEEVAGVVMLTGDEIGEEAQSAKAAGANVDGIIEKAQQLTSLIGPVLEQAKK